MGAKLEDILAGSGKLRVAEQARLLADNQRTLDMVHKADQKSRDLHARVEEARAAEKHQGIAAAEQRAAEEEMNILIDSPTTNNYATPATAASPTSTAGSLAKKAAIAAALLGAGGAAGLVPYVAGLLGNEPPAVEQTVDTDTQYELGLGQAAAED